MAKQQSDAKHTKNGTPMKRPERSHPSPLSKKQLKSALEDKRTAAHKWAKELQQEFVADMGGPERVTGSQKILIRQLPTAVLNAQLLSNSILEGNIGLSNQYGFAMQTLTGLIRTLEDIRERRDLEKRIEELEAERDARTVSGR